MHKDPVLEKSLTTYVSNSLRILIVDDDSIFGENLCELLIDHKYSVEFVGSGPEAITRIIHERFDIVITDLKMNGMNGFEVIRKIKHIHPGMKIILMTGYSDSNTRIEALECGAFEYITKPFLKNEIIELLKHIQ